MTAGELAGQFEVSKPTMSAHFAVLREAGLVESTKQGRVITYHLMMSVLEEAMLGFAQFFGLEFKAAGRPGSAVASKSKSIKPTIGKTS